MRTLTLTLVQLALLAAVGWLVVRAVPQAEQFMRMMGEH